MARYAIGMQDFSSIRKGGYVYVDKTNYIPLLLDQAKYIFLARPRRFGKSLFLSTLEYFFLGEKELFSNLSICSYDWDWESYPVIHMDLNGADYTKSSDSLNLKLNYILTDYENRYGLKSNLSEIQTKFQNLIIGLYESTGKKVVVLVDEYEKPILDTLDHPEISDKHKDTLRGFYGVLKSLDKYLKLVFLTGVTKFGQMNIFSGLNNIQDISLSDKFGGICGITNEEIREYLYVGVNNLALKKNISFEEAIKLLKDNYDGYHFSINCPDIYNPYSLINALDDTKISPYWSYTGTPTMLVKLMMNKQYNLEELDGIMASEERLLGIHNQYDDPVALFYQTGYLTIKDYDEDLEEYVLGFPNREVQKAFFNFVLPFYYSHQTQATDSFVSNINKAIIKGDPQKMMECLESFSDSISYDMIPAPEVERHFQSMLYIVVKILSSPTVKINPEWKTSDGRIDLLIDTPKYVYVIEIKRDSTPEVALCQIKRNEYALQFRNESREVYLIGVNFSTAKKRLEGFVIEKL